MTPSLPVARHSRPATLPSCKVAGGWHRVCEPSSNLGLANDRVANDTRHAEVDDLFAQWESDPLELLSLPDLGA